MQKVSFVRYIDNNVSEAEQSMFSSLIRTSVEGLVGGATGELGGFVMGLILDKIGWGTQGDSEEDKLLKSMNTKLDNIIHELGDIKGLLTALKSELVLVEEKILENVLDPTDAISYIDTIHNDFNASFGSLKAGEGNQKTILDFVNNKIYSGSKIEYDINRIHDAIIPPDSAKTPVLNNLTDYANDQYNQGYGTLSNVYNTLELYTSQLILKQLKGVNLFVEAIHVDKNGSGYCASDEDNNSCVQKYMQHYSASLQEMIGDPGNGESFIYNAYRLALLHVNPLPYKSGETYFSDEVKAFLHRAEFYRLMATKSGTFGPRILVFATRDIHSDNSFYIENSDAFLGWSEFHCSEASHPIPGQTYTYWDGNSIKPDNTYTVYECTIDDPIKPGTYDILNQAPFHPRAETGNNPTVIGQINVEKYDGNYTVSTDGNYTYGQTVFFHRSQLNHFGHDADNWHTHKHDMDLSHTYGSKPWGIGIIGKADGYSEYKGWYELNADFTYSGSKEQRLCIDYSAKYYMRTDSYYTGAGSSEAYAYVHFGIWDDTENKDVKRWHNQHQGGVDEQKSKHYYPKGSYCFTAKPNHDYYIYFSMHEHGISGMEGDGTMSEIYLDEIYYIYPRF